MANVVDSDMEHETVWSILLKGIVNENMVVALGLLVGWLFFLLGMKVWLKRRKEQRSRVEGTQNIQTKTKIT